MEEEQYGLGGLAIPIIALIYLVTVGIGMINPAEAEAVFLSKDVRLETAILTAVSTNRSACPITLAAPAVHG